MSPEIKLGEIVKRTYKEPDSVERKDHTLKEEYGSLRWKRNWERNFRCWVKREREFEYQGKSYLALVMGHVDMDERTPSEETTFIVLGEVDEKGYRYKEVAYGEYLTDVILVPDRERGEFRDYLKKERVGEGVRVAFWGGLL